MTEESSRLALSKKGQRQVTPFTGNELLYDHLSGVLDEERKKAVDAHLEASREAQLDYQKIQIGLQYSQKMQRVTVSPALQEKLAAPSTYFSVLFQKSRFDQWPVGLKWGLEALIVVFVIVTFLSLAPWEKVLNLRMATSSNDVVLTEINKTTPTTKVADDEAIPNTKETPQFVDEGIKPKETTVAAVATPLATPLVIATPASTPVAKATPVPKATPTAKVAAAKIAEETEASEEGSEVATKTSGGFLYRGKIAVTNLEAVGPKIKDKIMELGGRKAGEVELGWRKTPESAYFHFTIPEAKYEELQAFLSSYGTARVDKEKHPRVMPDGIIRLIITVDEAQK